MAPKNATTGGPECGRFVLPLNALMHAQRQAHGQVLFVPPRQGIGDIFTGLMCAVWVAILRRSALRIFWPHMESLVSWGRLGVSPLGASEQSLLHSALAPTALKQCEHVDHPVPCALTPNVTLFRFRNSPFDKFQEGLQRLVALDQAHMRWVVMTGNRGPTRALLSSRRLRQKLMDTLKLGPKPPTAAQMGAWDSCVLHALLQPSAKLRAREQHDPDLRHLVGGAHKPRGVCLQVRTGTVLPRHDDVDVDSDLFAGARIAGEQYGQARNISTRHLSALFDCARQLEARQPQWGGRAPWWHLSTDSSALRANAQAELGSLLHVEPDQPKHSRPVDGLLGELHGLLGREGQGRKRRGRRLGRLQPRKPLDDALPPLSSTLSMWRLLAERCAVLIVSFSSFGLTAAAVAQAAYGSTIRVFTRADDYTACTAVGDRNAHKARGRFYMEEGRNASAILRSTPAVAGTKLPAVVTLASSAWVDVSRLRMGL